jgi:hypothetical protein
MALPQNIDPGRLFRTMVITCLCLTGLGRFSLCGGAHIANLSEPENANVTAVIFERIFPRMRPAYPLV